MTPTTKLALLVALVLLPATARAEGPAKTYADLPLGTIAPPPPAGKNAVHWVAGHERAPGFHTVPMPNVGGGTGVEIFASADDAKASKNGESSTSAGCFSEAHYHFREPEWSLGEARAMVWTGGGDRTRIFHSERLVEAEGGERATLEVVDAWIDGVTRGAKVVSKSSVPLVRVGGVLDDLQVYAAREESAKGKFVHVVVKRNTPQILAAFPFMVERTNRAVQGSCTHARVTLRADDPSGDLAIVKTSVRLPEKDKPDATPAPSPKNAKDERSAEEALLASPTVEVRARELEVQLGTSQTSQDKTPVFTVSFGWSAREQRSDVPAGLVGSHRIVTRAKRRK